MKKLNLIVIGLGLLALQPLHGMSSNPLVAARHAVEVAESTPTKDSVDRARALINKLPSRDKAQKTALERRLKEASRRMLAPVEVTYGPQLEGETGPAVIGSGATRSMNAAEFEKQLMQLKADVAKLEADWKASRASGTSMNIEEVYGISSAAKPRQVGQAAEFYEELG